MLPSERYLASLIAAAERASGRPLTSGTTLVVDRCSIDNLGSNRVAESLVFTLVTTIGAVSFPSG